MSWDTSARYCLYCGTALPQNASERRMYCSDRCRRHYQDARRRKERADGAVASGSAIRIADPWQRADLWDACRDWALSLAGPLPDVPAYKNTCTVNPSPAGVRKKKRASWKDCWLVLFG